MEVSTGLIWKKLNELVDDNKKLRNDIGKLRSEIHAMRMERLLDKESEEDRPPTNVPIDVVLIGDETGKQYSALKITKNTDQDVINEFLEGYQAYYKTDWYVKPKWGILKPSDLLLVYDIDFDKTYKKV